MTRDEMILRMGYYAGVASRVLHDDSYASRWLGRAQDITLEDYMRETSEIAERLRAGGFIGPDEDPFDPMPEIPGRIQIIRLNREDD